MSLQPHYYDLELEMIGSSVRASASVGHSSSIAFDPIIEMVRSATAPTIEEKGADVEGSANSPIDTRAKSEPFVAAAKPFFKTPSKVSSSFSPLFCH